MGEKEHVAKLLQTLDRSQKSALEKYIHSPYFNVDEKVKNWFLTWLHHDQTGETADIIPGLLKKIPISVVVSIREVCLDFLAQFEFDNLPVMKVNLNLEGIRKRNIDKLYKDTLTVIEKLPATEFDQTSEFYYYRALIEKNIFELKTENEKKNAKVKIASELNMHKISENIDLFYILEIMKNAVHDYAENVTESSFIESSEDLLFCLRAAESLGEKYPSVQLYATCIRLLSEKTIHQTRWEAWQNISAAHFHKIPENEQKNITDAIRRYMQEHGENYVMS